MDAEVDLHVRRYRRGLVTTLLQFLILNYLEKGKLCGYDMISLLHERFHILLSPGQVYPIIDKMTAQGLIRKQAKGRMVLLESSPLGDSILRAWREEFRDIHLLLSQPLIRELKAIA